ncbi:MAG: hypothetical protein L3K23_00135 [Thermoplasmata archaeon]|nr:hypothetical protein [Thermoplasmata archaeon]
MANETDSGELASQLRAVREELAQLRAEQRELAHSVEQLTQTFRALATHLGIVAEPYNKSSGNAKGKEIPGFA